ncbi:hypothetical protein Slin15195_G059260 [Septoria linicola]|uniref:Rhodopsin domain-containing protein n=1 Tax=Septoria linicola TaxID=215465 RepID=A0A9Q9EJW2_9PEZI|nr:hypothetical protein Slin14017_G075120 [Septoria linicola]USW52607.1 hypothetical protein Slin15195_G059260 [Septoria linicola]
MPNRGPALVVITALLLLLATVFWTARVLWRYKTKQRGWDDVMAAGAWTLLVLQTVFGGVAVRYGFGKHRADTLSTFAPAMMYFYLYWLCFMILGTLIKLSFCCLYLRAFRSHATIRSVVKLATLITVMGGIAFILGTIWQCVPVQALWVDSSKGAHCINKTAFFYSHAAYSTVMDLVIYAIPLLALRTLRTNRTNKIGLITIFSLAAFVISASIARMAFLKDSTNSSQDPTWDGMPALTWAGVESSLAMILCCLPALGPFAIKLWCKITRKPAPPSSQFAGGRAPSAHDWYDFSGQNHGHNPSIGIFTNVHASPNASPIQSSYDLTAPPKSQNKWIGKLKSPFSSHSNSSDGGSAHEIRRPVKAYHMPKIELGSMYRPTSCAATNVTDLRGDGLSWQHTPWMSKTQEERNLRGLRSDAEARDARPRWTDGGTSDLADFLRTGPQVDAARSVKSEGYAGKGKGRAMDVDR